MTTMAHLDDFGNDGFRADQVPPSTGQYDPLPAGWQRMIVTASEIKNTKNGRGRYLQIEFTIPEGDKYGGRKAWDRLNLWNESQEAVDIAKRTLSSLCLSVGVVQLRDSNQLHGKLVLVKLAVREATASYDASNEVKGYKPADGSPLPNAQAVGPRSTATPIDAPSAPAPSPTSKPPWVR
jgi:hypothetical protein